MYQLPTQSHSSAYPSMSISGIQGQLLEVTVVGCNKLKDTEWISRQDPYVCLEYGSAKFRTRTCKGSSFFLFFLARFNLKLADHTFAVCTKRVQLQKVLSGGYDDNSSPLQTKTGRHAGEVRLILHYANANKPATSYAPSAPPYVAPSAPQVSMYSTPPPASSGFYPPPATAYPPPATAYPPPPSAYASYPPNSSPYPSTPYAPPQPSAYPPPYPPPSAYPPPPYPPPPHSSPYPPPPGPFPGIYPPPPY
ncbi:hypothetical protein RHGRI_013769 [Rhododendron griersonianum]|uniref:C2 domain-containing protein n=1 Tax=Rhododendron griersonianum TaxID=479676 RepID=A0AAV6K757_9ERIC|nr:hypothetical protein RHGRI_013769 [Rhododendron griersonianum]